MFWKVIFCKFPCRIFYSFYKQICCLLLFCYVNIHISAFKFSFNVALNFFRRFSIGMDIFIFLSVNCAIHHFLKEASFKAGCYSPFFRKIIFCSDLNFIFYGSLLRTPPSIASFMIFVPSATVSPESVCAFPKKVSATLGNTKSSVFTKARRISSLTAVREGGLFAEIS